MGKDSQKPIKHFPENSDSYPAMLQVSALLVVPCAYILFSFVLEK